MSTEKICKFPVFQSFFFRILNVRTFSVGLQINRRAPVSEDPLGTHNSFNSPGITARIHNCKCLRIWMWWLRNKHKLFSFGENSCHDPSQAIGTTWWRKSIPFAWNAWAFLWSDWQRAEQNKEWTHPSSTAQVWGKAGRVAVRRGEEANTGTGDGICTYCFLTFSGGSSSVHTRTAKINHQVIERVQQPPELSQFQTFRADSIFGLFIVWSLIDHSVLNITSKFN